MATPPPTTPAAAERQESPETARVQLARLATAAARAVPGVTGLDSGTAGARATFAGTDRLPGVLVIAEGAVHSVALFLTASPVDLHALSADIVGAVRQAAAQAGLASELGEVHVTFTDLTVPGSGSAS